MPAGSPIVNAIGIEGASERTGINCLLELNRLKNCVTDKRGYGNFYVDKVRPEGPRFGEVAEIFDGEKT